MPKRLFMTGSAVFFVCILLSACLMQPKNDPGNSGWRCDTPEKGSGIMAGYFRGSDQSPYQNQGDGLIAVEEYRCFKTMAVCRRWLSTMLQQHHAQKPNIKVCTAY